MSRSTRTNQKATKPLKNEDLVFIKNKCKEVKDMANNSEFHLSIEEQRARALESAVNINDISSDTIRDFFNWINKGILK